VSEGEPRLDFRDMTDADLEDGVRLSRASGWNQTVEDWRLLLSLGPGLFRVAAEDGRVVASGGAVRYGDALAWICMILVDPAKRGHGIGTRIFEDVLERTKACVRTGGLRCIGLDATPAGHGIYLQCGFQDEGGIVRMRAEGSVLASGWSALESRSREPGAIQDLTPHVRPLAVADLPAVLARDREVFGADRKAVLRCALSGAPDLAFVCDARGETAYCFGRHGDHSDQVGPVVADDPALAANLVRACLGHPRSRPLIVDARFEPSWLAALDGMGFREQRSFTRMYFGESRPASRPAREPAVFGPEFA
jgi:GNAT superfamily N-acetyltransferase